MQRPPLTPDEPMRLAALHSTGQLDTPIEARFEVITRLARRVLDVPIAAVSLLDADRQWFKSINGLAIKETCRDVSFCGHAILQDDIFLINDATTDPRFADNPLVTGPPHIVFYAGCPIQSGCGSNVAVMCVNDTKPRQMSADDLANLRDLAFMAQQQLTLDVQQSIATDLIGQIETEQRESMIDPLTRLWNRKGIDELLSRQVEEGQSCGDGVAVIVADIDRFKQINDRLGHPVGDEVLREVARRLLTGAGQGNSVGRHGGEEFLIVPASCDSLDVAMKIAERMRRQLGRNPVETKAGEVEVTASFGVVYAPPGVEMAGEALIQSADEALYRAKSAGRDCVRHAAFPRESAA